MVLYSNLNVTRVAKIVAAVFFCCLLLASSYTFAEDYMFWGQVCMVSPENAENASIPDVDLTGLPSPFVHVMIYKVSGELLGQGDAGFNGQYTVTFSLPAGPAPDIECRVYSVIGGVSKLLPAARLGINSFPGIGLFNQKKLRVLDEGAMDYGNITADEGFCTIPGVGLIFTRVGKVEIPYISQDTTLANRKVAGLADFTLPVPAGITDGATRAGQVGVPVFKQSPFANKLLIFGDFGNPAIAPGCLGYIQWYRVRIKKIDETAAGISYISNTLWTESLSKVRTEVQTFPTLVVTNTSEQIGPYSGVIGGTPIDGLYRVNKNVAGVFNTVVYSFPDLRLIWNTHADADTQDGLYEISLEYYRMVGGTGNNPVVELIPNSCFAGPLPPGMVHQVALNQLIIRVDNHNLEVKFNGIYLKDPTVAAPNNYYTGLDISHNPVNGDLTSAYDFNTVGICDIIHLYSKYNVEIHFTARHLGDYMRGYSLAASSNDNVSVPVAYGSDSFTVHTTLTDPLWEGAAAGTAELNRGGFTKPCAYKFSLAGTSRLQNGYAYLQWSNPWLAFYVIPN
jgi:hypothetical protein